MITRHILSLPIETMIDHPPLDLFHPVEFRGDVARQLTIGNLGAPAVERQIAKASRIRNNRKATILAVSAATECPKPLIASLSTVDLARAGEWVAQALEREAAALWHS